MSRGINRKIVSVPFGEWTPDQGELGNPGLLMAQNALRTSSGSYMPLAWKKPLSPDTGDTGALPAGEFTVGGGWHPNLSVPAFADSATGYRFRLGGGFFLARGQLNTEIKIYDLDPLDAIPWRATEVTNVSADYKSKFAMFQPFGQNMFCALGHDEHLQVLLSGGTHFVDATDPGDDNRPKPKFVAQWGNKIVIANISNTGDAGTPSPNSELFWLSELDNGRLFSTSGTDPGSGSDFFYAKETHGITGIASGPGYGVLFGQRAVVRVDYDSEVGVRQVPISFAHGTSFPGSVVCAENKVFFWDARGPAVLDYDDVVSLTDGRLARSILDRSWVVDRETKVALQNIEERDIWGAYDRASRSVTWFYKATGVARRLLTYSIASNAFTLCNIEEGFDYSQGESGQDYGASIDFISSGPDLGVGFSPLRDVLMVGAGFGSSGDRIWTSTADQGEGDAWNAPVAMTLGYTHLGEAAQFGDVRTRLNGIRLVASRGGASNVNSNVRFDIRIRSMDSPYDQDIVETIESSVSLAALDKRGMFVLQNPPVASLHQISLSFPTATTQNEYPWKTLGEIDGIDIEVEACGTA